VGQSHSNSSSHEPILEIFGNTTLKLFFLSYMESLSGVCFSCDTLGFTKYALMSSLLLTSAEHGLRGRVSALQELFGKSFENAKLQAPPPFASGLLYPLQGVIGKFAPFVKPS
jgi:hypothetical protein